MNIYEKELRSYAEGLLVAQAGVYSPYANLFAPFYRQQSLSTLDMDKSNDVDAYESPLFKLGYSDVERAFDYYIENLNKGRPFILAGHSQGSMVLIELLRNRFDNKDLQGQLVASYIIGYSLTKEDLEKYPWIKLATTETDTGVVITYNTQGPNAGSSPVLLEGAVAINPLNWKTDDTIADRSQNIEAKFYNGEKGLLIESVENFSGAYVDQNNGALIVVDLQDDELNEIDLNNLGFWPKEIYHRYDYSFFYENLKENVDKRINSYLENIL